jgi:tetratricopeptide (TPR) repeat protein
LDALAQDDRSCAGQKVVLKEATPLRVGGRVVDPGTVFRIYTVQQTEGDFLLLASGSKGGWVKADLVVAFGQAIDHFSREIEDHATASAYNKRGLIYLEQREPDLAFYDFSEALQIDPKCADACNNRGLALFDKKEFDKAISDYSESLRLDPESAHVYRNRGLAWFAKKEYDKAIADFTRVLHLDPRNALGHNSRGLVWSAKQDYARALEDFTEAVRLDPKNPWAFNNHAWLLATCSDPKLRNGKKAVESATRACKLSRWKEPYALGTLAAAYAEAGDFEKAVKWQKKMLEMLPENDPQLETSRARLELFERKEPYRLADTAG